MPRIDSLQGFSIHKYHRPTDEQRFLQEDEVELCARWLRLKALAEGNETLRELAEITLLGGDLLWRN